MIMLNLII